VAARAAPCVGLGRNQGYAISRQATKKSRSATRAPAVNWHARQRPANFGVQAAIKSYCQLLDNALAELVYWAQQPGAAGVKLHLGNSGLDLGNPDQRDWKTDQRQIAATLNKSELPSVVF
jgi:hypothetical protein